MDIYEILKEENQHFWAFLDLDHLQNQTDLSALALNIQHDDESYLVEEILDEIEAL